MLEDLVKFAKLTSSNTLYAESTTRDAFYQSHTWRNKRTFILDRDNRECQTCKANGKLTLENLMVHHRYVLEYYPDKSLDNTNLITVCQSCHNKIHGLSTKRFNDEWW